MGRFREGQWGATWIRWLNELDDELVAGIGTVQGYIAQMQALFKQTDVARAQAVAAAAQAQQIAIGGTTGLPTIAPSMLCDFANGRVLDPRFTRTREGQATYRDQMGRLRTAARGEPVFEWDANGRCRGLRVEPKATNLITHSENLTGPNWASGTGLGGFFTPSASTIPTPLGNLTAQKFVSTATTIQGLFLRKVALALANATTYAVAIDIYVPRQNGVNNWGLSVDFNDVDTVIIDGFAQFDRWVRVSVSKLLTAARTQIDFNIRINGGAPTVAGVELHAAEPQAELGASSTSYIPTAESPVTRPADVIALPAAAAAGVLNPEQGAFVVEFTLNALPTGASYAYVLSLNNGTAGEIMLVRVESSARLTAYVVSQGNQRASMFLSSEPLVVGQRYRLAIEYSSTGISGSLNGKASPGGGGYAPGFTPPAIWDRLNVGNDFGTSSLNGHIASLAPYNRTPSETQLLAMSAL